MIYMRKPTTVTDSNMWDDLIDSEKATLSQMINVFTDDYNFLGDRHLSNVPQNNLTNVLDLVADNNKEFSKAFDKFRIIACLLDIRIELLNWFEECIHLSEEVYSKAKAEAKANATWDEM